MQKMQRKKIQKLIHKQIKNESYNLCYTENGLQTVIIESKEIIKPKPVILFFCLFGMLGHFNEGEYIFLLFFLRKMLYRR